ncbi:MAG: hypothetical protein JWQ27_421 [Ferruginibacter sp.]|nr:hypothetical protein [Ferruginibacter sp.]
MNLTRTCILAFAITAIFANCNTSPSTPVKKKRTPRKIERVAVNNLTYSLQASKPYFKQDSGLNANARNILEAINRTDAAHLKTMDSILVPSDLNADISAYLPFPTHVASLDDVDKILLFSYPAQVFAAYENGELIYTGPTNMGRKKDPTPTGLYFTNWKAEQTTSTFNDEWDLKWNFNIENKEGIGFHQYELPGYPASHSCLRLREADAKLLYNWADQWELKGTDVVLAKGTPVIVFGSYPFDEKKPWLQLLSNPKSLTISEADVDALVATNKAAILQAQEKRDQLAPAK